MVEDYCTWPGRVVDSQFDNFRAVIGIPLKFGSEPGHPTRVKEVIGLTYLEEDRKFGDNEVALLNQFAELASSERSPSSG